MCNLLLLRHLPTVHSVRVPAQPELCQIQLDGQKLPDGHILVRSMMSRNCDRRENPPGSFHRVCSGKGQANVHARVARPAVLSNEGDNDSSKTEEWSFIHTASLLRAIEICLLLTQTPGLSTKTCQPSLLPVGPCCSFRPRQYSISS